MTQKKRQIYLLQNYSVCNFATIICFKQQCSIDFMLLLLFWGGGREKLGS